ncbi:hypothetical protein [Streptomyces mirabilis]|uniref:hypothetical protein n=1 Tax=Streptomyces mirabilis TaxID=68239 RepID=UPI0033B746E7
MTNRALQVIVHEVHPDPSLYACPDCGGRWPRGRPASADPVRRRVLPYLRVGKRSAVRTGSPRQTTPDKEEDSVHLEDTITSPYARVERDRSAGTYSIVVISEQPGNADTLEVLAVPDLPSGIVVGEDSERDALVCDAAEDVLLDASYELTSAWRVVGDGCYLVGVTIPDRVFEEQDERLRAAAAAVEGLESVEWTEAEALFETAEITQDGDLGSTYELDEWLEQEVNVAFYRTADGRLLARPVDRFERPGTKLFSGRYRSASLVSVFPNPRPVQIVLDRSQDVFDESDDDFEDKSGQAPERDHGSGDGDAFPPLYADADVSWPPVQRLNARRARQFLLASVYDRGPGELRWNDQLLVRGHALAFYASAGPDPRELIIRHYGGPQPGVLPKQPPQTMGHDDAYRLVAIYDGPSLFGKGWRHAVSTMPLESFLTVCVTPVDGEETEYALCVRDGVLHLLKDQVPAEDAVTVLGTPEPGSDPLALALAAVPDLLTFPPTAAVDISTSAPHAVADAVRFTSSPEKNTWENLYGEDWDDDECANEDLFRRHDDLTPLLLDINRTPHFAATVDGDWVMIPVDDEEIQLNRGFLTVLYDFEGGGNSSGRGSLSIGEIRPGLNAYWEDFSEENWNRGLTLSRQDLVGFAVEQVGDSRFEANIVHALIGGLDEIPEVGLEGDLENYEDVEAFTDFEPDEDEGLRFLRTLGDRYGDDSPVRRRIEAYIAEVATFANTAESGGRELPNNNSAGK